MTDRRTHVKALVFCGLGAVLAITPAAQQAPAVRATVDVVPVDVRVVDRRGQAVSGLTAADFTVREDGLVRDITVFEEIREGRPTTRRPPEAPGTDAAPPTQMSTAPASMALPRVFLIYLGRGRLQHPAMGVDAALSFVRRNLNTRDLVAVMAWNRATPFTTDAEAVVPVLERFRSQHTGIEQDLRLHFSGLRARLTSDRADPIPPAIQTKIDDVFGPRAVTPAADGDGAALAARAREAARIRLALEDAELTRAGRLSSIGDDPAAFGWTSGDLDDFAELNSQGVQDWLGLYAAVSYLSLVEGEKHLVFVTEHGVYTPRAEDDRGLAARAASARVAISVVHTGGTLPGASPNMSIPTTSALDPPQTAEARVANLDVSRAPVRSPSTTWVPPAADWRLSTSQALASLTGGYFTSTSYANSFFNRVDQGSDNYYRIGFRPSSTAPGGFRRIVVEVRRENVTVGFRRGYTLRAETPASRRQVLAELRLGAAGIAAQPPAEVDVTASIIAANDSTVDVELVAGPTGVTISETENGTARVALDVAVFCTDATGALVGHRVHAVDQSLSAADALNVATRGLRIRASVAVRGPVRQVRAVVYDSITDRTGTTSIVR